MLSTMVKGLLKASNKEDYHGYRQLVNIVVILCLFLLNMRSFYGGIQAHTLLLCWITLNISQLYSFFTRKHMVYMLSQYHGTNRRLEIMYFLVGIIENGLLIIYAIFQLIYFMKSSLGYALLIASIHILFAFTMGIFTARCLKGIWRILIIVIFYAKCFFSTGWPQVEAWRYISPTLQLFNINHLNMTNTWALIIWSIIFILISIGYIYMRRKRKLYIMGVIGLGCMAFISIIGYELNINIQLRNKDFYILKDAQITTKYKGIDAQESQELTNLLGYMIEDLEEMTQIDTGVACCEINAYYISYLNNLYGTHWIPCEKKGNVFYINIFSKAMVNLSEAEIFDNIAGRFYYQLTAKQQESFNEYESRFIKAIKSPVMIEICKVLDNQEQVKQWYETEMTYILQEPINTYNVVEQLVYILYQKDKQNIGKLYQAILQQEPENYKELVQVLEALFPEQEAIQEIINWMNQAEERM